MPYADPEQVISDWLTTHVFTATGPDRVRVVTGEDMPKNLQYAQRVVRIVQVPSSPGDRQPTLDVADVEINCYARTRDRTRDLANTVRAQLRYRLPKTTDPDSGAFVTQLLMLAAPAQFPSDTSAYFRRMSTCRLWLHHNPLG